MRRLLVVLLVTVACREPFGPEGEPFVPPSIYAEWYRQTERCSGRSGVYGFLTFRVVEAEHLWTNEDGSTADGQYRSGSHTIILARPFVRDSFLVRHEMLHALGVMEHPAEYFGPEGRCVGVVRPHRANP